MKNINPFLIIVVLVTIVFSSCEEAFIPSDVDAKNEYVIEGHIELSKIDIPAYVILTKSTSYFSEFDTSLLASLYIDDAEITVFDGDNTVELKHVCAKDLNPQLIFKLFSELGNKIFNPKFCAYLDVNNEINKQVGRRYNLQINHNGNVIKASTRIEKRINLDSIRFENTPGENIDSLAVLWATIEDPKDEANYYKYFVRENLRKVYSFNSLFNDDVIDGRKIDLPYQKPVNPRSKDFDSDIGFFYNRGDTIQFKLCTLDEDHYTFWESFQFSNNQGPFSSYIRAKDNIEGGIGIWGGYNCQVVDMIVPEN